MMEELKPHRRWGFYSAEAAQKHGTVFYATVDGRKVEVTIVSQDPEGGEYEWEDKVCVGEVTDYLSKGRRGYQEMKWLSLPTPKENQ